MFLGKKKDESKVWQAASGTADLRAFPRMSLKTIVSVRAFAKDAHCRLNDLSLGGLSFISPWQLAPGDPVTIVIPPPEDPVKRRRRDEETVEARVCRCIQSQRYGGWQVGVRFSQVAPEAKELIKLWFDAFGESPERKDRAPRRG